MIGWLALFLKWHNTILVLLSVEGESKNQFVLGKREESMEKGEKQFLDAVTTKNCLLRFPFLLSHCSAHNAQSSNR